MNKFKELIKSYEGSSPLFFYEECVLFPKVENNFIVTDQNYIDMIKNILINMNIDINIQMDLKIILFYIYINSYIHNYFSTYLYIIYI